jgi:hypothetical protein
MAEQSSPVNPSQVPNPTWGSFAKWGVGFAAYGFLMLAISDTSYGEAATALAWLVAVSAYVYWSQSINTSIKSLTGGGK